MKLFYISLFCWLSLLTSSCQQNIKETTIGSASTKQIIYATTSDMGEDGEDGIAEAQKMEFELTKDISLGYVPKYRLVEAYEEEMAMRRSGGYQNRATAALTWTERGPNTDVIAPTNGNTRGSGPASDAVTSGRMRVLLVDLSDPNVVWVGGIAGGLWKNSNITSTATANWTPITDFLGNLAISGICQNPLNPDIMYIGTGEKTFNFGAVRGGGIWKSIDHGVTWNLLANTTSYFNVSQMTCDAAGNVYVATIGSNGILRSNNGGTTWTNITPTGLTTFVTEMKLSSTGRLHISCGYNNELNPGYRYTDNPGTVTAGTWTAPVTTYPTAWNVELAVVGNTLYALPSDASNRTPVIYKSTDGGANWAPTATSPPGTATEPSINLGQGFYDLAIGADPNNPNNVFAGGLNFYKSTDGGATWTQFSRWVGTTFTYIHADHHNVSWIGNRVYMATDGGLYYSSDNGLTFTDRNDGLRLKQFYSVAMHPTTTNFFLAGAQDNGTHKLESAGLGGSLEVHGGDGAFVHIDQDQPMFQFSATTQSNYRRSINGGISFTGIQYLSGTSGQFINPTDYDNTANIMYTSAATGTYVRWEDPQTGATFTPISIAEFGGASTRAITVSPNTANRVFFGCFNGRVVRVDNANTSTPTATNITGTGMSASNVSCVAVGFNDNNLIATFSNYGARHVWVTTTGGGTTGWTDIQGNLPDIPVRWAMFYPEDNDRALLATEMGVYETDNIDGASTVWVRSPDFPFTRTDMFQYRASDRTVVAASYGRGLYTATIAAPGPLVSFETDARSQQETNTSTGATCRNFRDYVVNMNILQAPVGNANITLAINAGATATENVDFDITTNGNFTAPSKMFTFASGSATSQPITIRIYDDSEVESAETFTLSYTIATGTNATPGPTNQTFTFTINNNDVAPVSVGAATNYAVDGNDNITVINASPFRAEKPLHRIQNLYLASELIASGLIRSGSINSIAYTIITKGTTTPFGNVNISIKNSTRTNFTTGGFETGLTNVFTAATYTTAVGTNLFIFSTPFVWDGTSNIVIELCYTNTSIQAIDRVKGSSAPLGTGVSASLYSNQSTVIAGDGCALPTAFINDNRASLIFNANLDGNPISTTVGSTRTEYIASNGLFHFYSGFSIIAKLSAVSANLGCVTASITEAGNTWQSFQGGERSQKVFDITPTSNSGASYSAGIYFTAAELAGKTPSTLKIAKTNATTIAGVTSANTVLVTPTVTSLGTGFVFTGNFIGFSKFFLVDNNVVLPINLLSFSGYLGANGQSELFWQANKPSNFKQFEVERSFDAVSYTRVGIVAGSSTAGTQNYAFTDPSLAKAVNFYRLKMVDTDGGFTYSAVIKIANNTQIKFVQLLGNPVNNNISLLVNNPGNERLQITLVNAMGQTLKIWQNGARQGNISLPISDLRLAAAVYYLRVVAGSKRETLMLQKH